VLASDTAGSLAARILVEEHRLYPDAIQVILDGGWSLVGRRFVPAAVSDASPHVQDR